MVKDEHKYDTLLGDHDTSTDMEGEERWPRKRRNPIWTTVVKSLRLVHILNTILLLTVLALLLEKRWKNDRHEGKYDVGGDVTGFAPKFSQKFITFQPEARFVPEKIEDFYSKEVQDAWLSIVPRGLGFVQVHDPEKYADLPQPVFDFPNKTVFTTSVTHQLHCLYAIYKGYAALAMQRTNDKDDHFASAPWHFGHCFDYLRQSITCAGDTALEGARTTEPININGTDGWNARHVCKDYGEIYAHLERERVSDAKFIG